MKYPRTVKELKAYLEQRIDEREQQDEEERKGRAAVQRRLDDEEDNYEDALDVHKESELYVQRGWR